MDHDSGDTLQGLVQRFKESLRGQKGRSENTVRVYGDDLKPFLVYAKAQSLGPEDMDRRRLRSYLAWLSTSARGKAGGYARISVARKLVALRAFYRFLVEAGAIASNPVPRGRSFNIKVDRRLPTFLDTEEVDRLMEAPDASTPLGCRDRAILELLYSSGVRLAEVQTMDVGQADLEAAEVRVWGKGSKERVGLLGAPAVKALRAYLDWARPQLVEGHTGALFLNRYGSRLSRRSIEAMVSKYGARAASGPGVHPHTLRHTFATHLMEGGADLRVVQELLGHSSPATTQIYTHVTQKEARAAYMSAHPKARRPDDATPAGEPQGG